MSSAPPEIGPSLTTAQVEALLSIPARTIREWLKRGQLTGYQVGYYGSWHIPTDDAARFAAAIGRLPNWRAALAVTADPAEREHVSDEQGD